MGALREEPFCSVIVINYNGKNLLKRFLPSIINLDYGNFEVIVVDNASNDGSVEFIKTNYAQIKLVKNSENLGTAEGSNSGLFSAKGEYVFWLSNDMELDPYLLRYLADILNSSLDIGICTCKMKKLLDNEKTNIIDSVGGNIDIFGFPAARGINEKDVGQLDKVEEVFFSFGGAMLIRRSVLDKIGAFDPKFFTLADDIDLCWRAHLAGYKVVAQPKAVLYHRVSATLGTKFGRSKKRYWAERNTFRMLLKNYSFLSLLRLFPIYVALLMAEIFLFIFLKKFDIARAYIGVIRWNITNLKGTLVERRRVQKLRVLGDKEIQKIMWKRPLKIYVLQDYLRNRLSKSWQDYFI